MNLKELKEMLQLMAEHDLSEMEVEKDGLKIRLRKGKDGIVLNDQNAQPQAAVIPAATPSAGQVAVVPAEVPVAVPVSSGNQALVKSPMVGTFYAAASPDQPPYASVGQQVKEGDVLCIVEAMKLMNEIKSEANGVIEEIVVENGQSVEFDQVLFKIKKG